MPSDLALLLSERASQGTLGRLLLVETEDGRWQASMKKRDGSYRVHVAHQPEDALEYVLVESVDQRIAISHRNRAPSFEEMLE